jgi:hypothetical protein
VYDIPVSEKFQATTTSQEAYQSWQIPAKYQTPKAIYVYNDTSMASKTEYKDTFKPKTTTKYVHVMPGYLPNAAKFEAQSTNKTDYARPENFVKTQDFSPRHKYIAIPDSRDFTTENRGRLDSKILPVCPASHWIQKERTIHPDGHIYLAPSQV